ncbi:MAG: hypothetical protein EOO38_30665 [Cytophagaceae bacterium]|nr:MAG: hypothetical protein EOO38_30665 [Cytophagaceae bacterium]
MQGHHAAAALASGTRFGLARDYEGNLAPGLLFYELSSEHKGRGMRATASNRKTDNTNPTVNFFTFAARNMDALRPRLDSATRGEDGALTLTGQARWRGISNDTVTDEDLIEKTEPRFSNGYKFRIVLNGGPTLDRFTSDDDGNFEFTLSAATLGGLAGEDVTGTIAMFGNYGLSPLALLFEAVLPALPIE